MGRGLGNGRAFAVAMMCLGAPAVAADVDGAEDPPVAVRFPGSTIVAFQPETRQRSYEFVTGRVDRSSRDLRVDRGERVPATLSRVTYLTPEGARFDDVAGHYRSIVAGLDAEVAFTCRGRDCGRSTVWANDVFGVKELVAPDAAQFYLAATTNEAVLAIYVVQRGNRRRLRPRRLRAHRGRTAQRPRCCGAAQSRSCGCACRARLRGAARCRAERHWRTRACGPGCAGRRGRRSGDARRADHLSGVPLGRRRPGGAAFVAQMRGLCRATLPRRGLGRETVRRWCAPAAPRRAWPAHRTGAAVGAMKLAAAEASTL